MPRWGFEITIAALAISLTVNTLVTSLIVFKIYHVYSQVKPLYDPTYGGSKLRAVIFVLIESGMALFSIQVARLAVTILWTDASKEADQLILNIHEMLNVIIKIC